MNIFGQRTLLTAALFLSLGLASAQTEQTAPATSAEQTTITLPSGALTLPLLEGATPVTSFTTVFGGGVVYRGSVADAVERYAQALTAAGFTAEGTSAPTATTDTAGTTDAAATTTTDTAAGTTAATGTTDASAAATTGTGTAATGTGTTDTSAAGTAATGTTGTGTTDTSAAGTTGTGTAATGTTGTTDTSTTGTTDTSTAAGTATAGTAATTGAASTGTTAAADGPTGLPDGPVQTFVRNGERIQVRAYERGGLTVVVISRLGAAATGTTPSGG